MKIAIVLTVSLCGLTTLAQPNRRMDDARETIRCSRLAETKKKLALSDEQLLKVNELFDAFEEKRFDLVRSEQELRRKAMEGRLSEDEAKSTFASFMEIRDQIHQLERVLWQDMSAFLSGKETIEVFQFYDQFQKEVFRRVRNLQEKRNRPVNRMNQ